MTALSHTYRLEIAEDEFVKQAEAASIPFATFAKKLVQLCNLVKFPTSWLEAAEMWIDFIFSSIDIDDENEIVNHATELVKEMAE